MGERMFHFYVEYRQTEQKYEVTTKALTESMSFGEVLYYINKNASENKGVTFGPPTSNPENWEITESTYNFALGGEVLLKWPICHRSQSIPIGATIEVFPKPQWQQELEDENTAIFTSF